MKALAIKAGKLPEIITINNNLESLRNFVGGYIETIFLHSSVLVCNEEGKLDGLTPNRILNYDIIFGDFLILGIDGAEFCDITEEDAAYFIDFFSNPQTML